MDIPHNQEEGYIPCPSDSDGSEDGQVIPSIPWASPMTGISAPVIGRVEDENARLGESFCETHCTIYLHIIHQS